MPSVDSAALARIDSAISHLEAVAEEIAALRTCRMPLNYQERESLSRIVQARYRDRDRLEQIRDRLTARDPATMDARQRFFYGLDR